MGDLSARPSPPIMTSATAPRGCQRPPLSVVMRRAMNGAKITADGTTTTPTTTGATAVAATTRRYIRLQSTRLQCIRVTATAGGDGAGQGGATRRARRDAIRPSPG